MISWLISLIDVKWLLGGLAGVVAVVIAMFKGRADGAARERTKQLQRDAKAREVADDIDDAVAGRTAAENRKRLGKWASK